MPLFRRRFMRRRLGRRFTRRKSMRGRFRRLSRNFSTLKAASLSILTGITSSAGTSFITSVHNSAASSASNGFVCLSQSDGTAPGAGGGRVGLRTQLLRLSVQGFTFTSIADAATPTFNMGRIIFYMVLENGEQALGVGDNDITRSIINWSTATNTGIVNPYNISSVPSRVRIIKDIFINPFQTTRAVATSVGNCVRWRFSVNLRRYMGRDKFTSYNSTVNATSSCISNHVFAHFIQGNATPADPGSLTSLWNFKITMVA